MPRKSTPKQVQEQVKQVEEIYESLKNPEQDPPVEDPPTEDQPVQEPEQEQDPVVQAQDPVEEPTVEDPQALQTPQEPAEDDQTWEQRYRTLQGMFNQKVKELQQENGALKQRQQQMEQVFANMQAQQVQEPQQVQTASSTEFELTDKEREDYTPETLNLIQRMAAHEARQQAEHLRMEQQRVLEGLAPHLQQNEYQLNEMRYARFLDDLRAYEPDFPQLNDNADFHTWLLQTDPLTGTQRDLLLKNAYENYDVARTARFFEAFKAERGIVSGSPTPVKNGNGVQSELAHQIAPGKGRTLNPAAAAESDRAKYADPAFISKFYDDSRRGYYDDKPDERAHIEKEIFVATSGGR